MDEGRAEVAETPVRGRSRGRSRSVSRSVHNSAHKSNVKSNAGSQSEIDAKRRRLGDDPVVRNLLKELVNEKVEQEISAFRKAEEAKKKKTQKGKKVVNTPQTKVRIAGPHTIVKSPSDTTLYRPALRKEQTNYTNNLINKISDFVDSIRMESSQGEDSGNTEQEAETGDSSEPDDSESEGLLSSDSDGEGHAGSRSSSESRSSTPPVRRSTTPKSSNK